MDAELSVYMPWLGALISAITSSGVTYRIMRGIWRSEKSKDVVANAQNELIIRQQEQIKFYFERAEKLSSEKAVLLVQLGEVKGVVGVLEERLKNLQDSWAQSKLELDELRSMVRQRRKGDKNAHSAGSESSAVGNDRDARDADDR